jgi:hypothetical protein
LFFSPMSAAAGDGRGLLTTNNAESIFDVH